MKSSVIFGATITALLVVCIGFLPTAQPLECKWCDVLKGCKKIEDKDCDDDVENCIIKLGKKDRKLMLGCATDPLLCNLPGAKCCGTKECNTVEGGKNPPRCEICSDCPKNNKTLPCPNKQCYIKKDGNKITKGCDNNKKTCAEIDKDLRCCVGDMCNTKDLFKPLKCFTCDGDNCRNKTKHANVTCQADEINCFTKYEGRKVVKKGCLQIDEAKKNCVAFQDIKKVAKEIFLNKTKGDDKKEFNLCCGQRFCNRKPSFPVRICRSCGGKTGVNCTDRTKTKEVACEGFENQCKQKKDKDGKVVEMGCADNAATGCEEEGTACCFGDNCNVSDLIALAGSGRMVVERIGIIGMALLAAVMMY